MANIVPHRPATPPSKRALIGSLTMRPDAETAASVRTALETPADPAWTAAKIITLRSLYFTSPQDERVESAALDMWLDDLAPYPRWAIEEAVTDYRRTETRPPTPAAIVARAVAAMGDVRAELRRVEAALAPRQRPSGKLYSLADLKTEMGDSAFGRKA